MTPLLIDLSLSSIGDWAATNGARVVVVIAIAYLANRLLGRVVRPALQRAVLGAPAGESAADLRRRADTLTDVVVHTAQVLLVALALLYVLDEVGFNVVPLLTGLGVGGIALGLGAQTLVRDIISGLFILLENQYGRGDLITVGPVQGWVEEVNLRRTVVRDADGTLYTIPNGEVKISGNLTRGHSGINLLIPVAAGSDLDRAIALIDAAGQELAADPEIGSLVVEPPRAVRVEGLTPQSVTVRVLGKTSPGAQFQVAGALRRRIKRAFDEATIPFADPPAPPGPVPAPGAAPTAAPR